MIAKVSDGNDRVYKVNNDGNIKIARVSDITILIVCIVVVI